MAKSKELMKTASDEVLAQLGDSYAVEKRGLSITLPRLGMISQDIVEEKKNSKTGKKEITVTTEAGTFFIESESDEKDEAGKNIWTKEEIGTEIEGIIFYKRYQLRFFDKGQQKFISSPIFDSMDEVVPLFCDRKEIERGTPAELKALYQFTDERDGKVKSKLADSRILYVLYKGEMFQMNVGGTSMYSLMDYEKTVKPPTVLTKFGSIGQENGAIKWNKMTFEVIRTINQEEAEIILTETEKVKKAIAISKASFTKRDEQSIKAKNDFDSLPSGSDK